MKTLNDGIEVPARIYYYLLDWNEVNERKYMIDNFNKTRLCDLNIGEFKQLFGFATQQDIIKLK